MYFPSGQGWELGCSVTLALQAEGTESSRDSITFPVLWQDLCDRAKSLGSSCEGPFSLSGTARAL